MKFRIRLSRAALRVAFATVAVALAGGLCQCSSKHPAGAQVVVSVKDQKLAVYDTGGERGQKYPVSTSKYGINDKPGTYGTPVGMHEVVAKIGHGARVGAVFKNRRPTGEVIAPGTPGRDPIVSRIMWLRGMEPQNKNAYGRCIYIHGTADEADVGRAVSYGCIRMKSRDVVDLFNVLPIGARVYITEASLPSAVQPEADPAAQPPEQPAEQRPAQPPLLLNPGGGARPSSAPAALAENSSSSSRRPPEVSTPKPEVSTPKRQVLQDGSTVIYSAPRSGGPGVTLRSTRKAMQTPGN